MNETKKPKRYMLIQERIGLKEGAVVEESSRVWHGKGESYVSYQLFCYRLVDTSYSKRPQKDNIYFFKEIVENNLDYFKQIQ